MLCRVSRLAATRLNSLARGVQTIKSDIPWELRRPFQQVNRRRDDKHEERLLPAIPETLAPYVEAWVSSWERPAVRGGLVQLRSDVWAMPLRPDIVHRVVTWQRAGRRQGTAKTKSRAEVKGGGRKPRPQKGQGRSRQGSIRAPQWKGGGNAHPKRPRDWSYPLQRSVVQLGLRVALSDKYRRGALLVLDSAGLSRPKTKDLLAQLRALGLEPGPHRTMIVCSNNVDSQRQLNLELASRALLGTHVTTSSRATVYDLVRNSVLAVTLDAVRELETRLGGSLDIAAWSAAAPPPQMPPKVVRL